MGNKQEFLNIQQRVFERLPWGVHPCLTLNVYSIVENSQNIFSAIIDTHSIATVLGIPTFAYDSAPVRCQIKSEYGLWVITEMFIEQRRTYQAIQSFASRSNNRLHAGLRHTPVLQTP